MTICWEEMKPNDVFVYNNQTLSLGKSLIGKEDVVNTYKAFGLIIESEIVIDDLIAGSLEKPDVIIVKGSAPDTFENTVIDTPSVKISNDKYFSLIHNVAKYYVEKGRYIIVEPFEASAEEEVKLYLLGNCMGALLYQRRILPLHASCVNVNENGILLVGDSGAGKSTIASVLLKNGYKLLTDDVAAIDFNKNKEPVIYPGYPSQKLWEDTIERIGVEEPKLSLIRISKELHKYSVKRNSNFKDGTTPVKIIFEIVPAEITEIQLEEVKGTKKLNVIFKNTYRKLFVEAMEIREWYFGSCIAIANQVAVYRILRPRMEHLENDIAELIMEKVD